MIHIHHVIFSHEAQLSHLANTKWLHLPTLTLYPKDLYSLTPEISAVAQGAFLSVGSGTLASDAADNSPQVAHVPGINGFRWGCFTGYSSAWTWDFTCVDTTRAPVLGTRVPGLYCLQGHSEVVPSSLFKKSTLVLWASWGCFRLLNQCINDKLFNNNTWGKVIHKYIVSLRHS